jgi:protocatechuate 3,4-dioxygenase beta subunit
MRSLATLLFAFAVAGWAQPAEVTGRVVSSLNGQPLAGALVTLRGTDDAGQTYICETGSNGRFSITGVVPGTYEANPAKDGYGPKAGATRSPKDFPPVTVEAGKPVAPLDLRMVPEGVIAGRIVDSDGVPARRSFIELLQYGYSGGKRQLRIVHGTQTDDRGEYRFFYIAPGKYFLRARPGPQRQFVGRGERVGTGLEEGGVVTYYPGSADAARATELQLAPGLEMDGIDVRLLSERMYSIRGRILNTASGNAYNVNAQLLSADGIRPNMLTRLINDGYEIWGVPPGRYAVIGQSFPQQQGPRPPNGPPQAGPREFAREVVEVTDHDLEHIDLTFAKGTPIKGVVRGEAGVSVQDAPNISLMPASLDPTITTFGGRIDKDGSFTIDAAPGDYLLRIGSGKVYIKTVFAGKEPLPDGKIDSTHLAGDLTVVLASDFGKVEGVVTGEDGKPVYNAYVSLIPDQSRADWQNLARNAFTKADGRFSMTSIQPGAYKIWAWTGVETGAPQDAEFRKPYEERGVPVKLESNGKQTVELKVIQTQ